MDINDEFQELWDVSKEHLKQGRKVDLPHTRICVDFAVRLLREEGGETGIVIPAIILHDVGYSVIEEPGLYKKTTYYSVYKNGQDAAAYSSKLKELHMVEGAKLAISILKSLKYEDRLIDEIVDIVGNHEDSSAFPPSDTANINRIIVSDADKLFRVTPFNFSDIMKVHGASTEEAFQYLLDMKDKWLITDKARLIAEEEIRKIPDSHLFSPFFG